MIIKGNTGSKAEVLIRLFDSTTGAAITGRVWATGDVKIYLPDGVAWIDATVANIVEKGRGYYALRLAAAETDVAGKILLDLDTVAVPAASPHSWEDDIIDGADILAGILSIVHDNGGPEPATLGGLFYRLEALAAGKATGLNQSVVTFYGRDDSTVAMTTDQDVATGTRARGDISENP